MSPRRLDLSSKENPDRNELSDQQAPHQGVPNKSSGTLPGRRSSFPPAIRSSPTVDASDGPRPDFHLTRGVRNIPYRRFRRSSAARFSARINRMISPVPPPRYPADSSAARFDRGRGRRESDDEAS